MNRNKREIVIISELPFNIYGDVDILLRMEAYKKILKCSPKEILHYLPL